jgi:hypothetical protein
VVFDRAALAVFRRSDTVVVSANGRRANAVRLVLVLGLVLGGAAALMGTSSASDEPSLAPVPRAHCGPGSRPETGMQGRVPSRDYASGRARRGYTCNTREVSHFGHSGGFKVFRYVDAAGHVCAFYDSSLMFPTDLPYNVGSEGLGVVVLDMAHPRHPVRVTTLSTGAMDSPHESLMLSRRRGLLMAVAGNAYTAPGVVDVYDVKQDCRAPKLLSSTPTGLLGHESGLAPDGKTFYVSSTGGQTLTAIDLSDPTTPRTLFTKVGVNYHGMRVSDDGNLLYVADIGTNGDGNIASGGLQILDVSQIQQRKPNPSAPVLSTLKWRSGSIPQVPEPITIRGHHYLLEIDEFANIKFSNLKLYDANAPVGAARIINVDRPRHPFVVSNIRLAVNNQQARHGSEQNDPGASLPVQGYAGHYCSVPRRVNPGLAACSFIASGLRIFDISHPYHPREVGYFNKPTMPGAKPGHEGSWAMSAPAWDPAHRQVWYSDGNSGLYAVRLTNGLWRR